MNLFTNWTGAIFLLATDCEFCESPEGIKHSSERSGNDPPCLGTVSSVKVGLGSASHNLCCGERPWHYHVYCDDKRSEPGFRYAEPVFTMINKLGRIH